MSICRNWCAKSWFWYQKALVSPGLLIAPADLLIFLYLLAPVLSFLNTAHKVQFSVSGKKLKLGLHLKTLSYEMPNSNRGICRDNIDSKLTIHHSSTGRF